MGDEADELAGLPPNVVSSYAKAVKICSKYKPMEEMIASGKPGDAESLNNYQLYIGLEEDTGDPARVQVIYERSIADFPVTSELWLKYTEYLDSNLKVSSIIKSVYARAIRNCPWIGELWKQYLLALERFGTHEDEIFLVFEKSLQSGLQTPMEYMDLFLTRADSLRRMCLLKSESNETEKLADLKQLWETFDHASQFLTTYFPDYIDRSLQLYQYWARLEVDLANDVMAARGVWEKLIKSSGWMTEVWKSYISMELELRNIKEARSIYRRCYSRKLEANGAELICYQWLCFEREYGSLEDYDRAVLKVRVRLAEIKAMQLAQEAKAGVIRSAVETPQKVVAPDGKPKGREGFPKESDEAIASNKRKRGLGHKDNVSSSKRKKITMGNTKETVCVNNEKDPNQQELVATTKADQITNEPGHHSKESKSSLKQHVYTDKCTAFVSNIPFEVTEEQLHDFFSTCGGLKDVRIMRDRYTGLPRGIAYIDFETEESLLLAIQKNKQKLCGRPLSVAQSNPELGRSKPSRGPIARHGRGGAHGPSNDKTAKEEAKYGDKSDQPRVDPVIVGHRRGGHVKLMGSNTFALPRKLVKPLGWGMNEQRPAEAEEDAPKSNEEFRKLLLQP